MRRLIYYVACSVDHFIAQEDGSATGFLFEGQGAADLMREFPETIPSHLRTKLGVSGENQRFGAVVMGRKTYEVGLAEGVTSPYGTLEQFVVSRSMTASPDPAVKLIEDEPLTFVRALKQAPGQDIWLCGGGELAAALYPEIDSLILKVSPFVMGAGIPLFAGRVPQTNLALRDSRVYPNGFMLLHYELLHVS